VIAPTRGKCVLTGFLAGVRPKVWLSDRLPAQCTHAEATPATRQFAVNIWQRFQMPAQRIYSGASAGNPAISVVSGYGLPGCRPGVI
jgi:hypothetical protein